MHLLKSSLYPTWDSNSGPGDQELHVPLPGPASCPGIYFLTSDIFQDVIEKNDNFGLCRLPEETPRMAGSQCLSKPAPFQHLVGAKTGCTLALQNSQRGLKSENQVMPIQWELIQKAE